MKLPSQLENALDFFSRLPGVGEKTAMRHVFSLLKWQTKDIKTFSLVIEQLNSIKRCEECGIFSEDSLCSICSTPERSQLQTICIVENLPDCLAIEKTGEYRGLFHILGGVLNPFTGIGPENLTIDKLLLRIKQRGIKNIILALNSSVEGDVTCSYIKEKLASQEGLLVERIGFGIPMGGNLEYLDPLTINKALENRKML
jgi:recombination protein RecR